MREASGNERAVAVKTKTARVKKRILQVSAIRIEG
jgi:hypothetical protein